jgi:hypothetical protein
MEGYRSEEQSALQKRAVKRICDRSNRFHKRVIKNPARICDKKERCQLSREPESRQNGSTRGFDLISDVPHPVACAMASRTQPAAQSATQSSSAARITLLFAFAMRLAT